MSAGGASRHGGGKLAAILVVSVVGSSIGLAVSAPGAAAQSCLLGCAPTAVPAPATTSGTSGLLGLPCLICSAQPQLVSICGVTAYCPPRPTPAPRGPAERLAPEATGVPTTPRSVSTPVATVTPPPLATPAPTPVPVPPGGSTDSFVGVAPSDIAALSPVSGISFGGGLLVWPIVVLLDMLALVGLAVVLRRVWSRAPIT